ncbi:S1C family serine protease [Rhodococcus pyridinivorans]|uniref:S1C family serine protease n=1 Tax=Rhodococcus pyridinivorans TaxID=103816 RepID=UPI002283D535|nr:trypsin-like peptidase domain-containing protein [Rhodococcus pyridinivorans]WAL47526.1 trypsin-like peptidase domain-containing protein [Rhodococcus pyridinivorans]
MSEDPTRGAGAPQPQPHPYGPGGYTDPYAQAAQQPAPPPPAPGSNHPAPNHTASNRMPGRSALVVGAIALALVSGGVGGAVGAWSMRDSSGPVVNSLDAPRPETQTIAAAPEGSVQAVADRVVPSVVRIEVLGRTGAGEGSGVVLSSDGLILTNNHVVAGGGQGARLTVYFSDGSTAPATVVGADAVSDIAVIRTEGRTDLTPIELGSAENLAVGQEVVAVGSPLGLQSTVTAGIVSALNRPVSTSGDTANQASVIDAIQTDAAINPGNSGGALVDMEGRLVGINTAIATAGGQSGSIGLGFAIPVEQARRIAQELVDTGQATHSIIGVQVPSRDNAYGARVVEVVPDGPADRAGIPNNALIVRVDERVITDGDSLIAAIRSRAPGETVKITYRTADGEENTVDVVTTADSAGR